MIRLIHSMLTVFGSLALLPWSALSIPSFALAHAVYPPSKKRRPPGFAGEAARV